MKYIDTERIPKSEGNVMAATLYETMLQFYAVPENQAAFEKWLEQQKQEPKARGKSG